MNNLNPIYLGKIDFAQSIEKVGQTIVELKEFNIPGHYSQIEDGIAKIQQLDVDSYKKHFDNFLNIPEPGIKHLDNWDDIALCKLKDDVSDYVKHLSAVHNFMTETHIKFGPSTDVINHAYTIYNQALAQFTLMRSLFIEATESLERLSKENKNSFSPDSKEAQYSRFLLTMTGNLTRMDKEIKSLSSRLDDAVFKLTSRVDDLCSDINRLNDKIDCITSVTDDLVINSKKYVSLHQTKIKKMNYACVGLLLTYVICLYGNIAASWVFLCLFIFVSITSILMVYKFNQKKQNLIKTIKDLKTVFENHLTSMNKAL